MAFSFSSVEHFFASVFHDIHVAAKAVEQAAPQILKAEPVIEGLTSLVPGAGAPALVIERAAFQALGSVVAAVNTADSAAAANGLNVTLDVQTATEFKALIQAFSTQLQAAGIKV
jgi:hypothetical protein